MKRFLILFTALGLIAVSVASAEAKKPPKRVERTVEGTYNTQFVPYGSQLASMCDNATGCVIIDTRPDEAYFTAKVTDAHGQPVPVTVFSNDSNGYGRAYGTFCGETEEPIPFDRGDGLWFSPGYWDPGLPSWANCSPGFGTTGTISVTLSNLP